jgi:hypothetical protein
MLLKAIVLIEMTGKGEMCQCYVGTEFAPDGCCMLMGLASVCVGLAIVLLGEWWLH